MMTECQDCNKQEAEFIIYDYKKNSWFLVCHNCIKEEDLICDYTLYEIKEME